MYQNPFARALSIKERIASFWVTMGGCGISPIGPGTVGSIAGCGLFWLALPWSFSLKLATIGLAFVISIVAIEYLQRRNDAVKDASWIVIDEGVGVWIALLSWDGSIDMMVASFVLFRLFDIFKPYPISFADKKGHQGFWVMMDDVLAGLFAWSVLFVLDALRVFL